MTNMEDTLRLAVGVMGNAAALLLFASPILTFSRVIKKKSTEEFSCVPYILALLNCLLGTWYALPVVSHGWENFPVVTVCGLGILLEISFIIIYFWFASAREKMKVAIAMTLVIVIFCTTSLISAFALHDHHHRKLVAGSVGTVVAVAMYASPLVVVKQVFHTKSVEFMPFYLSFFSFLSSSSWMTYGLLSHDPFLTTPSLVGCPLSILQLMLYCKYRKRGVLMEEPDKKDLEKNFRKSKQSELAIEDGTDGKS
ncbi:Bidirectional sugar transporter SWEET3 [Morella rubra]|uniref:Bidirectional sugar transporter SWEET n=1 Tax=Morella rubra TaxID=262757 RepID=A0A6A1UY00_9ROSI|nr:Bidirectional sugar transporter SWEET3 [Morella rubra]